MKKKKHHKKSISRKLRDESNIFFSRYENNVTRSSFIRNYAKFIEYCRKEHNCKTKEECKEQIFKYIDYLKEKGYTASTIHAYLAPVGLYHGVNLSEMNLPKRHNADNIRSRKKKKYRASADTKNPLYSRTVEFQKCVGIRRNELKNLRNNDFGYDESGYPCVIVRKGKGGKETYQRIIYDVDFVKSFFDGSSNILFSADEMNNDIDYHHIRAEQAVRAYNYYTERLKNEPEYRKQLEQEIEKRWKLKNIDKKTTKPKPFDKKEIRGQYHIRSKNKELAKKKGLPLVYDKTALMAVSIFNLSHWRVDVTVSNYLLAVK